MKRQMYICKGRRHLHLKMAYPAFVLEGMTQVRCLLTVDASTDQ